MGMGESAQALGPTASCGNAPATRSPGRADSGAVQAWLRQRRPSRVQHGGCPKRSGAQPGGLRRGSGWRQPSGRDLGPAATTAGGAGRTTVPGCQRPSADALQLVRGRRGSGGVLYGGGPDRRASCTVREPVEVREPVLAAGEAGVPAAARDGSRSHPPHHQPPAGSDGEKAARHVDAALGGGLGGCPGRRGIWDAHRQRWGGRGGSRGGCLRTCTGRARPCFAHRRRRRRNGGCSQPVTGHTPPVGGELELRVPVGCMRGGSGKGRDFSRRRLPREVRRACFRGSGSVARSRLAPLQRRRRTAKVAAPAVPVLGRLRRPIRGRDRPAVLR